jgi:hypothetical protein
VVTITMVPFALTAIAVICLLVDSALDTRAGHQFERIRLNAQTRQAEAPMGRPDVGRPCGENLWWGGDGDYRGENDGRCAVRAAA